MNAGAPTATRVIRRCGNALGLAFILSLYGLPTAINLLRQRDHTPHSAGRKLRAAGDPRLIQPFKSCPDRQCRGLTQDPITKEQTGPRCTRKKVLDDKRPQATKTCEDLVADELCKQHKTMKETFNDMVIQQDDMGLRRSRLDISYRIHH